MPRGRPVFSEVRQRMVELIALRGSAYGADIFRIYREVFPIVTRRLIYYHLRKGTQIGEFKLHKVVREKGNFSWGPEAEKSYFSLGPNASPRGDRKLKKYLDSIK